MYKKLLLLLAVFGGSVCLMTTPVSAKEVKNGVEYWTVLEMREFMNEVDAEFASICGEDGFCKDELLYERAEADGKYRALETFEMEKLILSSINPSTNTVKLFYQDEDRVFNYMHGHPKTNRIEDFYMLWVEEWLGNPYQNGSWLTYGERYPYFLGDAATVESASHLMIDEDKDRNGADWFTSNIEREYAVTGSNLNDNTAQRFYYSLLESNGGRTNGVKDYHSCFKDTDYEPGMECRYLFGSDGVSRYFPFYPATVSALVENNTTPTSDANEKDDVKPLSDSNSTKNQTAPTQATNQAAISTQEPTSSKVDSQVATATKPVIVKSDSTEAQPQTATAQTISLTTSYDSTKTSKPSTPGVTLPKSGSCEKETIFPWWFIILVLLCDAIIMWFFWPKKSEKRG